DRRQPEGDGRDGRALGEDPDVQLSPEPRDRPPRERDPAQPRPRHRRRSRRLRRCARDAPASRGAGGGGLMDLGQALTAAVDRRVLVPRPETELVVETALRLAPGARHVLDVGTGSGAIAAALARELPRAVVWAADVDAGALAVARANLARHAPAVGLVRGDL